ncbi:MAG: hypothetical protein IH819_13210, partial [Bacteroidetes bacterium]|nr:hypothetical protein [Bacteroidota bacterium]
MSRLRNTLFFIFILLVSLTENYLGQEKPISIYGYLDLIGRDIYERQFPNGATQNPPPTFVLLRTHIMLNSHFHENWKAFTIFRFQNGTSLGHESINN